jgi:uncharacterized protein (DUF302 family)
MSKNTKAYFITMAAGAVFFIAGAAVAQGTSSFVKVASHASYSQTVGLLQKAISSNQLMVMGHINQAKVLSMTGLKLEGAETFLVGNPQMGKKALGMDPAAGAVLPARVYVWSDKGHTFIGYFKPSIQMTAISPGLSMIGNMLDKKLEMVTTQAAK